jgi:hypothetical protein
MTTTDFTYDVHDDEAAADFFSMMRRAGVGEERIAAMQATRTTYLANEQLARAAA